MPVVLLCLLSVLFSSSGNLHLQCSSSSALTGSSAVGFCLTQHWTFNKTSIRTLFYSETLRQKYYRVLAAGGETKDAVRKVKAELSSVKMWQGDDRWRSFCFSELLRYSFRLRSCRYIVCHVVCIQKMNPNIQQCYTICHVLYLESAYS